MSVKNQNANLGLETCVLKNLLEPTFFSLAQTGLRILSEQVACGISKYSDLWYKNYFMIVKIVSCFCTIPFPPCLGLLILPFPLQMCSILTQAPPHLHFGDACCLTKCGPATAACVAELQLRHFMCVLERLSSNRILTWAGCSCTLPAWKARRQLLHGS